MRLMRPGIIGEFLCLDYPGGPAVDKKQVIARPGWKLKFPHRHTKGRIAIELLHVLDDLARGFKRGVDLLAGYLFGSHVHKAITKEEKQQRSTTCKR